MSGATPSQALRAVRLGGFVLVLGAPAGTSLGVDLSAFVTGAAFRGLKGVPPGPHLLHWAASEGAARASLFFALRPGAASASV